MPRVKVISSVAVLPKGTATQVTYNPGDEFDATEAQAERFVRIGVCELVSKSAPKPKG